MHISFLLIFLSTPAPTPTETATTSARRVIEQSIARTRAILRDEELDRAGRLARLRAEADAMTDWPRMARSSGQTQWPRMTRTQRTRFERAFVTILRSIHLKTVSTLDPNRKLRLVSTELAPGGTWVDLRADDARLFDMTFGFLVSRDRAGGER